MNFINVHYLNLFLGLGAILLQVFSVAILVMLFLGPKENRLLDYTKKHFLFLGFFISLVSSIFPLVYSEIVGFLPCYLCWWQRIFMFPALFLFSTALWDQDRKVVRYVTPLIVAGFLVSVYQNFYYYFGNTSNLPCDASGVSCYQQLVSVFGGYISIPMLALTAFLFLLSLLAVAHFYKKE